MHFLRVNVKFHDEVNMIHDIVATSDPFPYTAKVRVVGVRNNKNIRHWRINRMRI